ncbi:MAG: PQQ-binding-like beta-propeller repeat protein [Candidatus Lokiarchaeota archaeon]|nr:PQQ-binding-like beta-propeller repeat protein [Candidatus Lokiarchaeota archaeon]
MNKKCLKAVLVIMLFFIMLLNNLIVPYNLFKRNSNNGVNNPAQEIKKASVTLWSYMTEGNISVVAISADGQYIAAGSEDKNIYVFDRSSSTPLWNYSTGNLVRSVSISADGQYIVAGSEDKNLYIFDRSSSTPLWDYTNGERVSSVAISADGEYIAAGAYDGNGDADFNIANIEGSYGLGVQTGDWIPSVSISADGQYFAAGSWDHKVYIIERWGNFDWSYTTGGRVNSVAFSADGRYIAAGSSDNMTYLFYNNYPPDPPYNPSPSDEATSVSNSPLLRVNVSDQDGDPMTVRFYDAFDDSPIGVNTSVASGEIASILWSGLSDGTIYSWYVVADDGMETTQSPIWSFKTNTLPNAPINPYPSDGMTGLSTSPLLKVDVIDLDGDSMEVRFYDASTDTLIGTDVDIINGSSASFNWSGLSESTIYSWYTVADDGKNITQSATWTFETEYKDDTPAIPGYLPMVLTSILLISLAGLTLYLRRRIDFNFQ